MLNTAEREVIRRQYQRYRVANPRISALQLTAKWAEKTHAVPRVETRQVIRDARLN